MTEKETVLYFYERDGKSFATPNINIAIARSHTNEIKVNTTDMVGQTSSKVIVVERED